MGVKSGCIVLVTLILIAVLSGCINQKIHMVGISEENQKLPDGELKNNQSTPVPTAEHTPIDTAQYTPASITPTPIPAPVTTTPRPLLIQTPMPTLTPVPTTTPVPTSAPISTPGNILSFKLLSLSGFYHYKKLRNLRTDYP